MPLFYLVPRRAGDTAGPPAPRPVKIVGMSAQVTKSIARFIEDHGGSAKAVLQPVGRRGVRITLVGADGIMGDQMVDSMAEAEAQVENHPQLERSEWDGALMNLATPQPGHAEQMAGFSFRR